MRSTSRRPGGALPARARAALRARRDDLRRLRLAARTRRTRPDLPEVPLPDVPPRRPIRVAVLLDTFSELAFRYEWHQVTFGPDDWREVLETDPPDLLFVESAWQGNGGRWRLHLTADGAPSAELRALVSWCRHRGIPTVFWNKEDPPGYVRFVATARLFDQVFTVDADRIPAYRADLGHDRVDLLPFAAQPRLHNPVRRGRARELDVAFAGTWFADKHDDRRRQLDYLLGAARDGGLHIWSRMETGDARYRFPARFRRYVVGSLPYERMLAAYTAYKVFLNVNSVTTSKTMCSRRLFELSAAQTAVVTAPAESIEPFFGDTVEVAGDADEARLALDLLLRHPEHRERLALRAHRRVHDEHLYGHRVEHVLRSVGVTAPAATADAATVSVVVPTMRPDRLAEVLRTVGAQTHRHVQLVLVLHGHDAPADLGRQARDAGIDDLVVRPAARDLTLGACMNLGVAASDGDLVAKVDDDNHYGRHYLSDLVRARDFSGADVAGKWAHLVHLESTGATLLRFAGHEHRFTDLVQGGTLLLRRDLAADLGFDDLPRRVDTTFLARVRRSGGTVYSADRFNFVSVRRADTGTHTWPIPEKELMARSSRLLFYGDPLTHSEA
ncbi:glycosyltransferase [Nocardioides guangzhouensis]|uniref:Glycosyltransferase n=1 Tax=Nocardioides guangzhouensis TaxID=2497878 RepID=A0A4Q4ZJU6_9ACTN|nr:glycosyltransferase [Nocardioides guangzhouensis]RYP87781.1 glycosyltransferase [Nocardioides guangzhouensis]